MINNSLPILSLLSFTSNDLFYFVQIIKRRKDHPEMKNQVSIIDRFFISSVEDYINLQPKIIEICNYRNARAYINLNSRSYKRCAFETLKIITEDIYNESYKNVKNAYYSTCGKYTNKKEYWFIDLDEQDLEKEQEILNFLKKSCVGVCAVLPSKSGKHIVVKPFDPREFTSKFSVLICKDTPTNLYIP